MSEINPYESPRSPEPAVVAELVEPESGGVWRQGNVLVMHRRATLPDRCVKSNQPAYGRRIKRHLYCHHSWIHLMILISLVVLIILALILQRRATVHLGVVLMILALIGRKQAIVHIGLSKRWLAKRRRAIAIGWGLILASIAMVVFGISMAEEYSFASVLIPLGCVVFLVGAIYRLFAARMVAPTRITDDYVWLKGVHRDYLAELPPWPYPS